MRLQVWYCQGTLRARVVRCVLLCGVWACIFETQYYFALILFGVYGGPDFRLGPYVVRTTLGYFFKSHCKYAFRVELRCGNVLCFDMRVLPRRVLDSSEEVCAAGCTRR